MQNQKPKIPFWLIAVYGMALPTILLWPLVAFGSIFAFDAPGSANDPNVMATVIIVLSYPLLPLVGIPCSFFAYRKGRSKLAYVLAAIGSVPLAAALLIIVTQMVLNVVYLFHSPF